MSYTFPNTVDSNELESNEIESSVTGSHAVGSNAKTSNPIELHVLIHEKAVKISIRYKKDEVELIEVLEQVENHKVYLHYKCKSLFQYGVKKLNLSGNIVYNLIGIMRKSREVPELKLELQQGNLNLSNARRIVPLLTRENKNEWIKKASSLSQLKLEKEIVKVRPRDATPERAKYINHNRIKLELGLFEKDMMKFRRVQDLVCQSKGESANLEDTLIAMMDFYLHHKDPVVKAKRVYVKKGFSDGGSQKSKKSEMRSVEASATENSEAQGKVSVPSTDELVLIPKIEKFTAPFILKKAHIKNPIKSIDKANHRATEEFINLTTHTRVPIPAHILHQVNLRDERKCIYPDAENKPCNQTRWTQIHHITPVSKGGKNTLENLVTLCSVHHQWVHARAESLSS